MGNDGEAGNRQKNTSGSLGRGLGYQGPNWLFKGHICGPIVKGGQKKKDQVLKKEKI